MLGAGGPEDGRDQRVTQAAGQAFGVGRAEQCVGCLWQTRPMLLGGRGADDGGSHAVPDGCLDLRPAQPLDEELSHSAELIRSPPSAERAGEVERPSVDCDRRRYA